MELEDKKNQLVAGFQARIAFLQSGIDNDTAEYNASVKLKQDEIDSLTLQLESLQTFDTSLLASKKIQ